MSKKEEVKIVKRASVRFGDYEIKCADIVRTAQKDGNGNGFAVGLVCGQVKDGGKVRFALVPLAEIIASRSAIDQAVFNPYTGRYSSDVNAARAVKKFAERFNVTVGERATAIDTEFEEKSERIKKSPFERVIAVLDKLSDKDREDVLSKLWEFYNDDKDAKTGK